VFSNWTKRLRKQETKQMGLTVKQKNERAALKAGTHSPAVDDFGNQYLERLPPKPREFICVHCGQKAIEIVGKQIMPGDLAPYRHAPGAGTGCPKNWGPLKDEDVREA
jgi:hypothetical protein